jgi:hypothetical protein
MGLLEGLMWVDVLSKNLCLFDEDPRFSLQVRGVLNILAEECKEVGDRWL